MPFSVHQKNYEALKAIIPDLDTFKAAKKLSSRGYMDLHIDFLGVDRPGVRRISMAHYFQQNGDMVADPDMEILIHLESQMLEAVTYQDQFGYKQVYPQPGMFDPKLKKSLNQFLSTWLKNLRSQGHKVA